MTSRRAVFATLGLLVAACVVSAAGVYIAKAEDPVKTASFVGTLVALTSGAAGLFRWLWSRRPDRGPVSSEAQEAACRELAGAVEERWRSEAAVRGLALPALVMVHWTWGASALAGGTAEATEPMVAGVGPDPVPGVERVNAAMLTGGVIDRLHDLYAGTPRGRLVILGGPGSGKTTAAILLLLRALQHRDIRGEHGEAPVPVLLGMSDWDPTERSLAEWASQRLLLDYPLLRRFGDGDAVADTLVRQGRVSLLLDGLDEMSEERRDVALERISSLSGTRVVLLSRPAEYEQAARASAPLGAVIELLPVGVEVAGEFLLEGHAIAEREKWAGVARYLDADSGSALAAALSTPLMLSLTRTAYPPGTDPSELADPARFPTREAIEAHLLERFLVRAYPSSADGHDAGQARRWLASLAHEMRERATSDLAWWHLPEWRPPWQLRVSLTLVAAVSAGLLAALANRALGFAVLPVIAAAAGGLALCLVFAMGGFGSSVSTVIRRRSIRIPRRLLVRDLRAVALLVLVPLVAEVGVVLATTRSADVLAWHFADGAFTAFFFVSAPITVMALVFTSLNFGAGLPVSMSLTRPRARDIVNGVALGAAVGLLAAVVNLVAFGYGDLVVLILLTGLAGGLLVGLLTGFVHAGAHTGASSTPRALWRGDLRSALLVAMTWGIGSWIVFVVFTGFVDPWLVVLLPFWLAAWVLAGLAASRAAALMVAGALSRIRNDGPLLVIRFLEQARERSVLRQAGAFYQFRHAALQNRLAEARERKDQPNLEIDDSSSLAAHRLPPSAGF